MSKNDQPLAKVSLDHRKNPRARLLRQLMQLSAAGTREVLALHRVGHGLLLQHRRRNGRLQDLRHRTHARFAPVRAWVSSRVLTSSRGPRPIDGKEPIYKERVLQML